MRALADRVRPGRPGVYPDRPGRCWSTCCARPGATSSTGLDHPDGDPVEEALRDGRGRLRRRGDDRGTGLTPADLTPEMTRRLLDRKIRGIAEAIRAAGAAAGCPPRSCPVASPGWPATPS